MNLIPINLPETTMPANYLQLVCRNCLASLQPDAVYHAAQLADLGWTDSADKYEALKSFLHYHKIKLSDKRLCEVLGLAIKARAREVKI
jgi:hypothetical protein